MATRTLFPIPEPVTVPVNNNDARFPVRRIICVGRNYADHAREMGAADQADGREPPFFFAKPTDGLCTGEGELAITYPPMTQNLQHEVEMVLALGKGGSNIPVTEAEDCILAYGIGLDLTRRDIQAQAKEKGHPWDMGKGFDCSAVLGPLTLTQDCGHRREGFIRLHCNGALRQNGNLANMAWKPAEVIANLSRYITLTAGDLIYTGTPAGVAPIVPGDQLECAIEGLGTLRARVVQG